MTIVKIIFSCFLFLSSISLLHAQNVGIGTTNPVQKLEVVGIVRLEPESHVGTTLNRLVTIDSDGDVSANLETGLGVQDAVTYDLSGQVIKPTVAVPIDLPGPIANYTVVGSFKFYTTCDGSAEPIVVNFKRYGTGGSYAFTYTLGNATSTTNTNSVVTIPYNFGCGNRTLTITLNPSTNELNFSVSGTGVVGLYLHSGRTTLLRWL